MCINLKSHILCFVAALGHSHRVARLHRDNFAHVLLERHLQTVNPYRYITNHLIPMMKQLLKRSVFVKLEIVYPSIVLLPSQ